jgi:Asp-tRNA(Asn)/Glu-tRNA(Gln) amidotransferase A subunit family amidase
LPLFSHWPGPVGLMVVGEHGVDRHLLALARGIEAALATQA